MKKIYSSFFARFCYSKRRRLQRDGAWRRSRSRPACVPCISHTICTRLTRTTHQTTRRTTDFSTSSSQLDFQASSNAVWPRSSILEGAEVQRVDGERPGSPRRGGLRRRRRHTQRHAQRLIGHAAAPCSESHTRSCLRTPSNLIFSPPPPPRSLSLPPLPVLRRKERCQNWKLWSRSRRGTSRRCMRSWT